MKTGKIFKIEKMFEWKNNKKQINNNSDDYIIITTIVVISIVVAVLWLLILLVLNKFDYSKNTMNPGRLRPKDEKITDKGRRRRY